MFIGTFVTSLISCDTDEESSSSGNGHAPKGVVAVDLGLSVKWANMNVGASKPEDYGNYYAWGETETKEDYSWTTYFDTDRYFDNSSSGVTFKKYEKNSGMTTLDLTEDVAHVKWGHTWRMPTEKERKELVTKCTINWTSQGGVNGCVVTGPNGNTIFLPAAGNRSGSSLHGVGKACFYWMNSLDDFNWSSLSAVHFGFHSDGSSGGSLMRKYGVPVRPVCP